MAAKEENADDLDEGKFATPEVADNSNNSGKIDLEPGSDLIGHITDVDFSKFDHGVIEIDGRELSLNSTMRQQLENALVRGEPVRHTKAKDQSSFEDSDGETVTYHERNLQFMESDD